MHAAQLSRGASAPHHARPAPQGGRDTPTLGPGVMLVAIVLPLVLSFPSISKAQAGLEDFSVRTMLRSCEVAIDFAKSGDLTEATAEEALLIGTCFGMARGVGSMLAYACSSKEEGYLPLYAAGVPHSNEALVQAFVNWARENPDMWQEDASDGLLLSTMITWPCELGAN